MRDARPAISTMRGYLRTRAPADRWSASRPAALFVPHRRPSSWSSSSLGHVLLSGETVMRTARRTISTTPLPVPGRRARQDLDEAPHLRLDEVAPETARREHSR